MLRLVNPEERNAIPSQLFEDKYWKGLLHIFMNHGKLKHFLSDPAYFDFEEFTLHSDKLLEASKDWGTGERFMLEVALHMFNGIHKVDLSKADVLEDKYLEIVIHALRLRYAG